MKKKIRRLHSEDARLLRMMLLDQWQRVFELEVAVGELQGKVSEFEKKFSPPPGCGCHFGGGKVINKVFAVYDVKGCMYRFPHFAVSVGIAVRDFADACKDQQSAIAKHPTDYILYELGEFDDCSGVLSPLVPPKHLGLASDYVEVKPVIFNPAGSENGSKKEEVVES